MSGKADVRAGDMVSTAGGSCCCTAQLSQACAWLCLLFPTVPVFTAAAAQAHPVLFCCLGNPQVFVAMEMLHCQRVTVQPLNISVCRVGDDRSGASRCIFLFRSFLSFSSSVHVGCGLEWDPAP